MTTFCNKKKFELRLRALRHLSLRDLKAERNYWKKFYKLFTDFLYNDIGCYDNYAGGNIKNLRLFFSYLNKDLGLGVGEFYKLFYVRKETIPIFPLLPEELNFLISDTKFERSLSARMRQAKDVFVFGCTVALRISDLMALKTSNIRIVNNKYYLAVRSLKTGTDTLIKLPLYAVEIVLRYSKLRKSLLPYFTASGMNSYIRELLRLAGFTHPVSKKRERRGEVVEIFPNSQGLSKTFRFCDLATTHTMRRTAITTMLSLGMPEAVVRKISGHAPGSKEFYRYVLLAQTYQDQESDIVFEKLKTKQLLEKEASAIS